MSDHNPRITYPTTRDAIAREMKISRDTLRKMLMIIGVEPGKALTMKNIADFNREFIGE